MVNPNFDGFEPMDVPDLDEVLSNPTDERLFAVAKAMYDMEYSIDKIFELSKIDRWFLHKLQHIVDINRELRDQMAVTDRIDSIPKELLVKSKRYGFSDLQISKIFNATEFAVREFRKSQGIVPFVKRIDTLAAEFPASTNYLYTTYSASTNDVKFEDHGIVVLGSGVYRIGSSVEFDWCGVSAIRSLRNLKQRTIMINYNPETVSTDFDECDRLYFEELSLERVLDIYEIERASGCIVSVGGQLPQNIALKLHNQGVKVLGTSPIDVDNAENRQKFSKILDQIGLDQPDWAELTTPSEAFAFAERVSYPVLVRPSYVLSGAAMNVAFNALELETYLKLASDISPDHPVVITKYINGAQEIDVDAAASEGELLVYAVSQHIENAGVHSGDATLVLPPLMEGEIGASETKVGIRGINTEILEATKEIAVKVAKAFKITGPFNMQLILSRNEDGFSLKVIECNLRASRSFPFVSKVLDTNFIDVATRALMKAPQVHRLLPEYDGMKKARNFKAVKCPVFSWTRLAGADPILGVEMASTGEIACFGSDIHEAYLTSFFANHNNFSKIPMSNGSGILLSTDEWTNYDEANYISSQLSNMGYNVFADDEKTLKIISTGSPNARLFSPDLEKLLGNNRQFSTRLEDFKIQTLFSLCVGRPQDPKSLKYRLRSTAVSIGLGYINNSKNAILFVDALNEYVDGSKLKRNAVKSAAEWIHS